jgi:LytS/YehU family sensor histidine kinase
LQEDSVISDTALALPFGFAPLTFRFEVIAPKAGSDVRIKYRLSEDEDFSTIPIDDAELKLYRLSEGNYTLEAYAESGEGLQSSMVTYPITVKPPFTRTIWFYLLLIGLAASITAAFFLYRLYFVKKRLTLQRQIKSSELKAVKSQMNPHFIFNLLNSIQYLITKGDNDGAYSYINRFAKLVRNTLDHSEQTTIPLEEEIQQLRVYMELEELRFMEDLTYEIVAENLPTVHVPPMLIQPFIENALIHGLLHKQGKKRLRITFNVGEVVTCVVEDNGIGREKAKAIRQRQRGSYKSFATMAIEKRFALLRENYHEEIGFRYEDLQPANDVEFATRVIIQIPFEEVGK